jgi:hypothetical protein
LQIVLIAQTPPADPRAPARVRARPPTSPRARLPRSPRTRVLSRSIPIPSRPSSAPWSPDVWPQPARGADPGGQDDDARTPRLPPGLHLYGMVQAESPWLACPSSTLRADGGWAGLIACWAARVNHAVSVLSPGAIVISFFSFSV